MLKSRYLHNNIMADLRQKMVFVGGPRQVGKTTLAKQIGAELGKNLYLNWDNRENRKQILADNFTGETGLVIFDEIHKYRQWKNYVKGIFDVYRDQLKILVTGSARLDLYRRGGDSLQGRYHYYRLHPFSLRETLEQAPRVDILKELSFLPAGKLMADKFQTLLKYGGFPEPFLAGDDVVLKRFHNERTDRLIKEDIRDLESVRDLSALQFLVELLPSKVGSLFSLNSLREDLQAAHKSVALWLDILERFYYHFRIYPFNASPIKSLRKEPKLYLWDWSEVGDMGARLENLVASHLLKFVHYLHDSLGDKAELYFLRDIDGRETDFLVAINKKPLCAVEVKNSDLSVSSHLKYFSAKLKIPYQYQLTSEAGIDFTRDQVRVMSADKFLSGLV